MNALLALLILAISDDASIAARYPQATEVFRADFDESGDRDFDRWPDLWTRRRGPGFPHYLRIEIVDDVPPGGGRAVRMDLDGQAASITSPPLPASADFEYALEGMLRTTKLRDDRAFVSLTFLDALYNPVEHFVSAKYQDSAGWKRTLVGPAAPASDRVRYVVVNLHLEPSSPERADLTGSAWFGNLRLVRMPRVTLGIPDGLAIFARPEDVAVRCRVSGFERPIASVRFELLDVFGSVLQAVDRPVQREAAAKPQAYAPKTSQTHNTTPQPRAAPAKPQAQVVAGLPTEPHGGDRRSPAAAPTGSKPDASGVCEWRPAPPGPGFYRVRTTLRDGKTVQTGQITLAVLRDFPRRMQGEFGWSLPGLDMPVAAQHAGKLLELSGIHWVKVPLWLPADAPPERIASLADRFERLSLQGFEVVGVFDQPPGGTPAAPGQAKPAIAEILSMDRETWQPSMEATIVQLAGGVHWWQLGGDRDTSFTGYAGLHEKLVQVRKELKRVEHHFPLGFAWDFAYEPPPCDSARPAWSFVSFSSEPSLTAPELLRYLSGLAPAAGKPSNRAAAGALRNDVKHWVLLEPIDAQSYSVADRAADLAGRMMAAKAGGAAAVFVSNVFDDRHGLFYADGSPGELFLPWRTMALAITGREYLGQLALPERCANRVFAGRGDATMVVWSPVKTRLEAYFGDDVRHMDLWGRALPIQRGDGTVALEVGPLPTIVTGVDRAVAAWRATFAVQQTQMQSAPGRRLANALTLQNTFDEPVEGTVSIVGPKGWDIQPQQAGFRLGKGERFSLPLSIALPASAAAGPQTIRADFDIGGPRAYRFSAWGAVEVGFPELHLEASTHLNARGELEVEQRLTNNSDSTLSFRCNLYAPGARRQTVQVSGLGRGSDLKTYRLPGGRAIAGKTLWLQVEEIGGGRVLNHRFTAEP